MTNAGDISRITYLYPMRQCTGCSTNHVKFVNNVFSSNDKYGNSSQIWLRWPNRDRNVLFSNNLIYGGWWPGQQDKVITIEDPYINIQSGNDTGHYSVAYADENFPNFSDNVARDPEFADEDNFDHAPAPWSSMIDGGRHLTRTRARGPGSTAFDVWVDDSRYFSDGLGVVEGDLIAVGTEQNQARIESIDHSRGVLHVDRPVAYAPGDVASLAWNGAAPDLGAYETGDTGRLNVQVVTWPFRGVVGQAMYVEAHLRGQASCPCEFTWFMGDGTQRHGPWAVHGYSQPGSYGVRLRVHDGSGRVYYAASYLEIQSGTPVLYRETFDPNARDWWVRWRIEERPRPASYEHVKEGADGWIKITNPTGCQFNGREYKEGARIETIGHCKNCVCAADGTATCDNCPLVETWRWLPAGLTIRDWDVDNCHKLTLRYKIPPKLNETVLNPGIPDPERLGLGLYIGSFRNRHTVPPRAHERSELLRGRHRRNVWLPAQVRPARPRRWLSNAEKRRPVAHVESRHTRCSQMRPTRHRRKGGIRDRGGDRGSVYSRAAHTDQRSRDLVRLGRRRDPLRASAPLRASGRVAGRCRGVGPAAGRRALHPRTTRRELQGPHRIAGRLRRVTRARRDPRPDPPDRNRIIGSIGGVGGHVGFDANFDPVVVASARVTDFVEFTASARRTAGRWSERMQSGG